MFSTKCGHVGELDSYCTRCGSRLPATIPSVAERSSRVPDGAVRSGLVDDLPHPVSPRETAHRGVHGLLSRWGWKKVVPVAAALAIASISLAAWSFSGRGVAQPTTSSQVPVPRNTPDIAIPSTTEKTAEPTTPEPVAVAPITESPTLPGVASCSATVSVGANTSCPFALNVESAWHQGGDGTDPFDVTSPVTSQSYSMQCMAGAPTVCRGGNKAVVYIQ
jgi:hypothetical protein